MLPIFDICHQSGTFIKLRNLHGPAIITRSVWFTSRLTVGVVPSVGLDQWILTRSHRCGVPSSTCLTSSSSGRHLLIPSPNSWQPLIFSLSPGFGLGWKLFLLATQGCSSSWLLSLAPHSFQNKFRPFAHDASQPRPAPPFQSLLSSLVHAAYPGHKEAF